VSNEDATRMLATFNPSQMSRWSGVSQTCLQRVVLVEFGERRIYALGYTINIAVYTKCLSTSS